MASILGFLQLAGAVALLLFGLGLVRDGMVEAFGLRMKLILGAGTRTGLRAFASGLVATLGLQSSTATALLTEAAGHSRISHADYAAAFVAELDAHAYPRQIITAAY